MDQELSSAQCVVRHVANIKGRVRLMTPDTTSMHYLHFGRIHLDAGDEAIHFETEDQETGLLCLKGRAMIHTDDQPYILGRYDALYVPRDTKLSVQALANGC